MKRLLLIVSFLATELAALGRSYEVSGINYTTAMPMDVTVDGQDIEVFDYTTGMIYYGEVEYNRDGSASGSYIDPITLRYTQVEIEDEEASIYEF